MGVVVVGGGLAQGLGIRLFAFGGGVGGGGGGGGSHANVRVPKVGCAMYTHLHSATSLPTEAPTGALGALVSRDTWDNFAHHQHFGTGGGGGDTFIWLRGGLLSITYLPLFEVPTLVPVSDTAS